MTGVLASLSSGRPPVMANVSPANATAITSGAGTGTTNTVTVTATGGVGAFTYSWARVSGDVLTITASSSAATAFSGNPGLGGELGGTYRCTVTDAIGSTATADVDVVIYDGSFV